MNRMFAVVALTTLSLSAALPTPVLAEPTPAAPAAPAPVTVSVTVQAGYHPSRIEVPAGVPVRLRFLRTEWTGCTREVVFPSLGGRRVELPTHVPVDVDLGILAAGEVPFHCGMNMIHGVVVVGGAR